METNNEQHNDADILQDSMDHSSQLSWTDGDEEPNHERKEGISTAGTINKDLWARLQKWYRFMYYGRRDMVVSCYNRLRAGLRFCRHGTGYSESFNALLKKHIAENNVPLPEVPERVRSYLHEKRAAEHDVHTVKVTHFQPLLQSSGLFKDAMDLELFCRTLTPYAIRSFRDEIVTPSSTYVISDHTLIDLSDDLAEDSLSSAKS